MGSWAVSSRLCCLLMPIAQLWAPDGIRSFPRIAHASTGSSTLNPVASFLTFCLFAALAAGSLTCGVTQWKFWAFTRQSEPLPYWVLTGAECTVALGLALFYLPDWIALFSK